MNRHTTKEDTQMSNKHMAKIINIIQHHKLKQQ